MTFCSSESRGGRQNFALVSIVFMLPLAFFISSAKSLVGPLHFVPSLILDAWRMTRSFPPDDYFESTDRQNTQNL
jgi:hypothetical protein